MKFTIVVVMLALAFGAQASILPWNSWVAGHGLAHTVVSDAVLNGHLGLGHGAVLATGHSGPLLVQGPALGHAAVVAHSPISVAHHASAVAHNAPSVAHHTSAVVHHAPAAVAVAHAPAAIAVAPIAHEGQYVAKTRGAVHTAPLSGHINSAASVNLAPAPGTI